MPSARQLSEFALIKHIARRFGHYRAQTLVGIGDDCAVTTHNPKTIQLITTDLLIEDIHFDLRFVSYRDIGYKAMIANLSDIAAMGGVPRQFLVSIALPSSLTQGNINSLYEGMMEPARKFGAALIGGDTSASTDKLFLSITLIGEVQPAHLIKRTGLSIGDEVFVTGTLGDSQAGLRILQSTIPTKIPISSQKWLCQRHLRPSARLDAAQKLAKHKLATSMIDISDGLSGDLSHLCNSNKVGATIDLTRLPVSSNLRKYSHYANTHAHEIALHGGEDYELLFTVNPNSVSRIKRWNTQNILHATHIGTIMPQKQKLKVITQTGRTKIMPIKSFNHFPEK